MSIPGSQFPVEMVVVKSHELADLNNLNSRPSDYTTKFRQPTKSILQSRIEFLDKIASAYIFQQKASAVW